MVRPNYATCDVGAVITYSVDAAGSDLSDRLLAAAEIHASAARTMRDPGAVRSATEMAQSSRIAAKHARRGGAAAISGDIRLAVPAFAIAALMQELPRDVQASIVARTQF